MESNIEQIKTACRELEEALIEDLITTEAEYKASEARRASRNKLRLARGRIYDMDFDVVK
jgi:hypothetical protein